MRRIAQIVGFANAYELDTDDFTYDFVKYLFQRMMKKINDIVHASLTAAFV